MPTAAESRATVFIPQFDESSRNRSWVNGHAKISTYAAAETATVADGLVGLIRDHEARASYGRAARALAEREFPLAPFQEWLYGRLQQLAAAASRR